MFFIYLNETQYFEGSALNKFQSSYIHFNKNVNDIFDLSFIVAKFVNRSVTRNQ